MVRVAPFLSKSRAPAASGPAMTESSDAARRFFDH
jgi:hypothetical protein